jgi:hypothetical protein
VFAAPRDGRIQALIFDVVVHNEALHNHSLNWDSVNQVSWTLPYGGY